MRQLVATMSILAMFTAAATAQQRSVDGQPGQTCTLKVSGMVCGACAKTVEKAAKKIAGVKSVTANQPKGVAEITYDPGKTSPEAIAKAITERTPFRAEVEKK